MILNEDLNVPMLLDDITLSVSSSHDQMVFTFMSLIYRLYSTDEERRGIFDSLKYRWFFLFFFLFLDIQNLFPFLSTGGKTDLNNSLIQ